MRTTSPVYFSDAGPTASVLCSHSTVLQVRRHSGPDARRKGAIVKKKLAGGAFVPVL